MEIGVKLVENCEVESPDNQLMSTMFHLARYYDFGRFLAAKVGYTKRTALCSNRGGVFPVEERGKLESMKSFAFDHLVQISNICASLARKDESIEI